MVIIIIVFLLNFSLLRVSRDHFPCGAVVMQSIASTAPYPLPLDSSGSSPFITRPERGLYGNGMSCPGESDPIFIPGGEQQRREALGRARPALLTSPAMRG